MAPVMSANENVYEDIGPDSQIVRNLIRTESQVRVKIIEKLALVRSIYFQSEIRDVLV